MLCGNTEYLETQAANLCIAIEGYHRYAHPRSPSATQKHKKQRNAEILDCAPQKHREWLKAYLEYSHAPSLRERFRDLLDRSSDTIEWLIGSEKKEAFIKWALRRRNTYSHGQSTVRDIEDDPDALKEYCRVQFLRALLFMCLLYELGFSESEIDRILRENQLVSHAVSQWNEPGDPKRIHVRGKRGEWVVYTQGQGFSRGFKGKKSAIEKGRAIARERRGVLIIHKSDGSVQKEHNYAKETRGN